MPKTRKPRRLADAYAFPGFRASATVRGCFGDPQARIITLARRSKKRTVACAARCIAAFTTAPGGGCAICRAVSFASTSIWRCRGTGASLQLRAAAENPRLDEPAVQARRREL